MQSGTGQSSLVIQQCSLWPALLRFYGIDQRMISNAVPTKNYVCEWDEQSMQIGRGGQDPVYGLGAYAEAAAREPNLRNGANLEANDSAYWSAIAYFNPTLSSAEQQEKGLKLLKRAWLEGSWAHIATRQGTVRRAMSFMSRDYWDAGTVDPTVQSLMTSIVPTAPFGMAVYYSTNAERTREQQIATGNPYVEAYYDPSLLYALKNEGVPVNYFVSDAALSSLKASAKPAAWIILEHPELISSTEMQKLTSIAPVLTTTGAVEAFQAPLQFSGGLTGAAFYDENDRLIVTATDPSAATASGFATLRGLENGTYTVQNLATNTTFQVTVKAKTVSVPLSVARWILKFSRSPVDCCRLVVFSERPENSRRLWPELHRKEATWKAGQNASLPLKAKEVASSCRIRRLHPSRSAERRHRAGSERVLAEAHGSSFRRASDPSRLVTAATIGACWSSAWFRKRSDPS